MASKGPLLRNALLALGLSCYAYAQTSTPIDVPSSITDCHAHLATEYFCVRPDNGEEVQLSFEAPAQPTATADVPQELNECHTHGSSAFCVDPSGNDVQVLLGGAEEESSTCDCEPVERNCHFHAGVEHCVGGNEEVSCERVERDYNIPLRIGLLFVILVTSGLGVFAPILIAKFNLPLKFSVLLVIKQFGTGVILSTAFVHLYTHAQLMFANECLGELTYEATTSAIVMAGIFISFLIDYISHRFVHWRRGQRSVDQVSDENSQEEAARSSPDSNDKSNTTGHAHSLPGSHTDPHSSWGTDPLTVASLEAGILFHSILIGLTLVVAGDDNSSFLTLFAVILFHQMFEGLALGSMIAQVPGNILELWKKLLMGLAFTLITPIGMAIGIGVLDHFNGNDKGTIIAIGTLDAFSAGILVWVGVVEMLAKDWMDGPLLNANMIKTGASMLSLIAGMVVMSVLGKWA